jgi:putative phosphoesterase
MVTRGGLQRPTTRSRREEEEVTEARIAVISDTHGRLYRRVLESCAGADHIIHAGDVGSMAVLEELARLAPLTAVRGNRDRGGACEDLPAESFGEVAGLRFVVAHKRRDLKAGHPDPVAEGLPHDPRPSMALVVVRDGEPDAHLVFFA